MKGEREVERKGWDFWVGRMSGWLCYERRSGIWKGNIFSEEGWVQFWVYSACFLEGHPGKVRPGPGFVVMEVVVMEKMPKAMGGNEFKRKDVKRKEAQNEDEFWGTHV